MPIYLLTEDISFPSVEGTENGIVAIGGDLSPERLMLAYHSGIFPWYSAGEPITWYSMDPRFVLFPDRLHISRSMKTFLRKEVFNVTFNQNFVEVINQCRGMPRNGQEGTWITDEMQEAYLRLHALGHAKSVEVWKNNELVGGMYGIDLGSVFCGESMFSKVSNASKVGMIAFIQKFKEEGGRLFDCQVHSDHLESMGAVEIPRSEFLEYLE